MSAKHTPGPWTQGKSKVGIVCVWLNGLTEPEDGMGPDCTWIDCNTEGNASLIAAVHDLLMLAQDVSDGVIVPDLMTNEGLIEVLLGWQNAARAAIAKAIG